jgi:hypothetical protein
LAAAGKIAPHPTVLHVGGREGEMMLCIPGEFFTMLFSQHFAGLGIEVYTLP